MQSADLTAGLGPLNRHPCPLSHRDSLRLRETMARLDWQNPFLFLYSQDDPLCDAAKLDGLVQEKHSRCVRHAAVGPRLKGGGACVASEVATPPMVL